MGGQITPALNKKKKKTGYWSRSAKELTEVPDEQHVYKLRGPSA
jgi:hypothetical protein